ncbi:MAG: hypothetical protein NVSMB14_09370 [Isosphaeraceae bacterium]
MKPNSVQFRLRTLTILVAISALAIAPIAALAKMTENRRSLWLNGVIVACASLAPFFLLVGPYLLLLFFDHRRRRAREREIDRGSGA